MKPKKYKYGIPVFVLRSIALLYLLVHFYLYIRDIVSLPFLLPALFQLLQSDLLFQDKDQGSAGFHSHLLILCCPFCFFRHFSVQRWIVSSADIDFQFFWFDSSFIPFYSSCLYSFFNLCHGVTGALPPGDSHQSRVSTLIFLSQGITA